jgi:hypothetical protein
MLTVISMVSVYGIDRNRLSHRSCRNRACLSTRAATQCYCGGGRRRGSVQRNRQRMNGRSSAKIRDGTQIRIQRLISPYGGQRSRTFSARLLMVSSIKFGPRPSRPLWRPVRAAAEATAPFTAATPVKERTSACGISRSSVHDGRRKGVGVAVQWRTPREF